MKYLLSFCLILLTGCSSNWVSGKAIAEAEQLCSPHSGVWWVRQYERVSGALQVEIVCRNAVRIEVLIK